MSVKYRSRPQPRGFTLVEMLTVLSIVALLAALLFPVFASAKRAAGRTACAGNMKQVATAIVLYVHDNDDHLCPERKPYSFYFDWRAAHLPYLKSYDILRCPGDATHVSELLCTDGPKTYFECLGSSYQPTFADTLDQLYVRGIMYPLLRDPMNAHRAVPFTQESPELWRSNLAFPDTSVRYLQPTYGAID